MMVERHFRTLFGAVLVAGAKMTPDATRTRPLDVYSLECTQAFDLYFSARAE
jgi:hypothetical protein